MTGNDFDNDPILDRAPGDALDLLTEDHVAIAAWSDEKKKEFVATFKDRSDAAQAILILAVEDLIHTAKSRHFIGQRVYRDLEELRDTHANSLSRDGYGFRYDKNRIKVGGRSLGELDNIAKERVKAIINELPTTLEAVSIIDKELADKIKKRDSLLERMETTRKLLEEEPESVSMAEVDQTMSIADFRVMIDKLIKTREGYAKQLQRFGKDAEELTRIIDKALYSGLPGLSDAVVKVVRQHLDRATALGTLSRRVGEQVIFGDSAEALELLKTFESDEVSVSSDVHTEFKQALEKLRVSKKDLKKLRAKK